jgi:hypothetical protein
MIILLYLFHKYWKKLKTNQILIYIILKIFVKKNSIFVRLNFTYGYNDRKVWRKFWLTIQDLISEEEAEMVFKLIFLCEEAVSNRF